jgi:tetratricopeptide (TPR) repeat protein
VQAALQQQRKEVKLLAALDRARGLTTLTHDGQWASQAAAEAYARAFVDYFGEDVRSASAQTLAGWLQRCPAAMVEPLIMALEDWAGFAGQKKEMQRMLDQADPDPWRRSYRAALMEASTVRLRQLAEEAQGKRLPAGALLRLGIAFFELGEKARALALLRTAQASYPDDFWLNFALARVLYDLKTEHPELVEEAIGFYRAALARRPGSAPTHINLGLALEARKDLAGAIAEYQKALALDPNYATAHVNLGGVLYNKKDLTGAIAAFQKALALDPKCVPAHHNLGLALYARQDLERAIACYHQALALDPNHAPAYSDLGAALLDKQDVAGAIACYKKALLLDPKLAQAHNGLGKVLLGKQDVAGAIACFQKVLDLDPKLVGAYNNLGAALMVKQDVAGAIAVFQKALVLDPNLVQVHHNLGLALYARQDVAGAIAAFRKALAVDPNFAPAHYTLATALRARGEFAESLAVFRSFQKLTAGQPAWKQRAAEQVRLAEQLLELDGKLPGFLKGEVQPSDANQGLLLNHVCCSKELYAAAVRFARYAFAAQPQLADDLQARHRYLAACSAVLAACGQSKDAPTDAGERAALRQQALQWLRADLTLWSKRLAGGTADDRLQVQQFLAQWRSVPYLAGVREDKALAALPEAEQQAWRQLWADVAGLQKQAQEKK